MRASFRLLVLIGLFLTHAEARAARSYFDATGSIGNNSMTVAEGATRPTLIQYSVGLTLGWQFDSGFLLGGTSDMRFINQYSEPTTEVGNQQGTRFNTIAPTIGFIGSSILVKADYQTMGDYELTAASKGSNSELKYSSPKGKRLNVLFPLGSALWIGLVAESVEYQESSVTFTADAPEKVTTTQFGLVMTRTFTGK